MNRQKVIAFLFLVASLTWPGAAQPLDRALYVNNQDPSASDSNAGTPDAPLLTIQEAMDRATTNKNNGLSTQVTIAAGVYRESVEFAYSNYQGGGTNAEVVVDGAGPESTIIKGSDVFDSWQSEGGGVFSHAWTEDWGVAPDPTGGYITDCGAHPNFCADEPDLVLRREMVFVDGERMQQVLTSGAMEPGTFRVDEGADKLYLQPPTGVTLGDVDVEVGKREKGWWTEWENNFTLRGIGVQHCATQWRNGWGAIKVSGNDNTAENIAAIQNNFVGLRPNGENITLRNFTLDENGASGFEPFEVKTFLVEDGQVNGNNWRGHLGGYTGWSVGNKFFSAHGVTIRNTEFNDNLSRGLWLDTDIKNCVVEDVELRRNLRDNLWIERTQGPVTLRRVISNQSEGYGLLLANAEDTAVEDSRFIRNDHGGIHISGDVGGIQISDFETGNTMTVETRELTLTGSVISEVTQGVSAGGGQSARFLIGTTFPGTAWNSFIATYEGNHNVWFESTRPDALEWAGDELITLGEWKNRTGQDQQSIFLNPGDTTTQPIPLHPGWNVVSSRINPATPALESVLSEVGENLVLLKDFTGGAFISSYPLNSIGDWNASNAYQIYLTQADTLTLTGQSINRATTSIPLNRGWNLIPHYKWTPEPIEDALASITHVLLVVKDESGQTFIPGMSNNTLQVVRPGHGYKAWVTEDILLTFPNSSN